MEIAGTPFGGERHVQWPRELDQVWTALDRGAQANSLLARAGRDLADLLFDDASALALTELINQLRLGQGVDIVLRASGQALRLPLELLRLPGPTGSDEGPLSLRPGLTFRRQVIGASLAAPVRLAGPVKVLAAVAAPEETSTKSPPLDVEQEMQDILDATQVVAADQQAFVRILEVASLEQISAALDRDAYHVLHLSAHGSPTAVELEDEDGESALVTVDQLVGALHHAGRPIPLIVLSACSGAAQEGADAMAAGLVMRGADRVIAMQASVTADYANMLSKALYADLVAHPERPVAELLATARYDVEQQQSRRRKDADYRPPPEFGLATLICAGEDAGLVDSTQDPEPLAQPPYVPGGGSVRELTMGELIGRRAQLRAATGILRRTRTAQDEFGAVGGVTLVGAGGIGKTAVAGRLVSRLHGDGWRVVIQEGLWNPNALFQDLAGQLADSEDHQDRSTAAQLVSPDVESTAKLELVERVLSRSRTLILLDDFEQNLTESGADWNGTTLGSVISALGEICGRHKGGGGLLVTCRYPLPDHNCGLARVDVGLLSASELGRMFRRLPKLRDLPPADRRLLQNTVGGHPRMIEFIDALMRGGQANLVGVSKMLRRLADDLNIDVEDEAPLSEAVETAMTLGAANLLLDNLVDSLSGVERKVLAQVSVSRAPMTVDDLAFAVGDGEVDVRSVRSFAGRFDGYAT